MAVTYKLKQPEFWYERKFGTNTIHIRGTLQKDVGPGGYQDICEVDFWTQFEDLDMDLDKQKEFFKAYLGGLVKTNECDIVTELFDWLENTEWDEDDLPTPPVPGE